MKISLNNKRMDFAEKAYNKYMLFHGEILDFIDTKELSLIVLCLQKFHRSLVCFLKNKLVGGVL